MLLGENMIGKILMDIRSTLASIPRKTPEIYKPFPKPHPPVLPPVLPREVSTPTSTDAIRFFHEKDDLYPLTTFSMFRFKIADCVYRSLNHYFQAQKFTTSPEIYQSIIDAPTPVEAINISQENAEVCIRITSSVMCYYKHYANPLKTSFIGSDRRFQHRSD